MLNLSRRGSASISSVFRLAASSPSRICSTRLSLISTTRQCRAIAPIPVRSFSLSTQLRDPAASAAAVKNDTFDEPASEDKTVNTFEDLKRFGLAEDVLVHTISREMKINIMTDVQKATINEALAGTDIVAQARTGTGKTLGFLVPTIQNILKNNPQLAKRQKYSRAKPTDIKAIIISPTRELAEQIAVEAERVCKHTDIIVQVAVGGNSKRLMLSKVQREGCHILVATPGRLNDLLTDEFSRVRAPGLTTLILDEADRLLDDGFSRDIEAIIDLLPDRNEVDRQTLLFSATMPKEVMHLVRSTLKPGFSFVQTVKPGDVATHEKVPQKVAITAGVENFVPCLIELVKREQAKYAEQASTGEPVLPFKAIVYLQATANVELTYQIFENLRDPAGGQFARHLLAPTEILQIHGQLSQAQRTNVADRFRRSKSAILFSTDVTARGMDFPNVSHVVQFGLPSNREQYIHRIGRTGRADKGGEAWLIIQNAEASNARRMLTKLPIVADKSLEAAVVDMSKDAQLPASLAATLTQAGEAAKSVSRSVKNSAYNSALSQNRMGRSYVEVLNRWSRFGWGMETPPEVSHSMASKMGLSARDGLNIASRGSRHNDEENDAFGNDSRGFGGGRGFSGGNRGFGSGSGGSRSFGGGREERGFGGRGKGGFGGNRGGSRVGRGSGGEKGGRGFSGGDRASF